MFNALDQYKKLNNLKKKFVPKNPKKNTVSISNMLTRNEVNVGDQNLKKRFYSGIKNKDFLNDIEVPKDQQENNPAGWIVPPKNYMVEEFETINN